MFSPWKVTGNFFIHRIILSSVCVQRSYKAPTCLNPGFGHSVAKGFLFKATKKGSIQHLSTSKCTLQCTNARMNRIFVWVLKEACLLGRRQWHILRLELVSIPVLIWNKPLFMLIWAVSGLDMFSLQLSIFFILPIKDLHVAVLTILPQNPWNSFCSLIFAQKTRI